MVVAFVEMLVVETYWDVVGEHFVVVNFVEGVDRKIEPSFVAV